MFGNKKRSFSANYYKDFDWLEYSVKTDSISCYACRHFGAAMDEEAFRMVGFRNWKKTGEKLKKHNVSLHHIESFNKWHNHKKTIKSGNVLSHLSQAYSTQIGKNMNYLRMLADVSLTMARQGMPFRSHEESESSLNKGNFKEICGLIAKYKNMTFYIIPIKTIPVPKYKMKLLLSCHGRR